MTPTQARAFHAVAQAGSFTGAARRLNVSQPTITTQVKELERTYGIELFRRSASGAKLTETGSTLFAMVDDWHEKQRECCDFLSGVRALRNGRLTIGTYGPYDAIDLTAAMRESFPGIEVSIMFSNSNSLKDQLASHEIDVAIMSGMNYDASFRCLKFRKRRLVVLMPKDCRWKGREAITLAELAQEPLICRESGSAVRACLEQAASRGGYNVNWSAEIGSREGIVAAVERGLGIGVIFEEGYIPVNSLDVLAIRDLECDATVDVVCLADRASNRIIKSFTDLATREAQARQRSLPAFA
ncbi:MAG: LysR substrate-binding domain-containing protein [Minwuia sp.]|nr:LysR substrate-binding domain-containing protein [Minwuia sp.]